MPKSTVKQTQYQSAIARGFRPVGLRFEGPVYEAISKLAKEEYRSRNQTVRMLVDEALAAREQSDA